MTTVERSMVETTDFGVAQRFLRDKYHEHRLRTRPPLFGFVFESRLATVGDLAVDQARHDAVVDATADPYRQLMVLTFVAGRYAVRVNRHEVRFASGDVLLVPIGVDFDVHWERVEYQMTRLPMAAVERVAAWQGVKGDDLRFDAMTPISPGMNRQWASMAAYLARSFSGPEPVIEHPLVRAATLDMAAAVALAAFPNTTMTVDYVAGPGRVDASAVRRAVAYIDAHADRPITLDDIAAAAGVPARALRSAFTRHADTTPARYLRRVRMERAHRDLQSGDETRGDTVAMIARRWGFASAHRFAVEYRRLYRQPPARTLRT